MGFTTDQLRLIEHMAREKCESLKECKEKLIAEGLYGEIPAVNREAVLYADLRLDAANEVA